MERLSRSNAQRGQAAIMMALSLIPTLGLLGLVVDVGWAYWRREAAQTAAQSAAFAAAMAAKNFSACNTTTSVCQAATACPTSPTNATNIGAGCLYAKQNGFINSGHQTITIAANTGTPPVSGASPSYWVSAVAGEKIPTLFSYALGQTAIQVNARSTAGVFAGQAGACIYALKGSGTGFSTSGNPTINATCGIYVDSSDGSAMTAGGSDVITASTIKVVGGYSPNGHPSVTPAPTTGAANTPDPLAGVAEPSVPSRCDSPGLSAGSPITMGGDGKYVVCGGWGMTGNGSINLPAGTYIFTSGTFNWHNGSITASGPVTLYLTGTFSGITINGNMNVRLSAPTSGSLQGMLFFEDRSITIGSIQMNGGSSQVLGGSIYLPNENIQYAGGSNTISSYTSLIGSTISFVGNSYFTGDVGGLHSGIGVPKVALFQ